MSNLKKTEILKYIDTIKAALRLINCTMLEIERLASRLKMMDIGIGTIIGQIMIIILYYLWQVYTMMQNNKIKVVCFVENIK